MKKAIFFFADSKGMGITSHFSRQVVDMYKQQPAGLDFWVVSDKKEQNKGCWQYVEETIPTDKIIKYDEHLFSELCEKLFAILKSYDEVVFHIQGVNHIRKLKKLLELAKVHSVVTVHSFEHGSWRRPLISFIYGMLVLKYVDKIIFTCPFSKNIFTGHTFLRNAGKIVHIPFSISELRDFNIYKSIDEKFRVVYLANFSKVKQHEVYLDAIINFSHAHPDVVFEFLGEGKCLNAVLKKVKLAGLESQIRCPGRLSHDEALNCLSSASVALAISASETFGHNAVEPVLMGKPVIATRVGAAEYFIQDYVNGFGIYSSEDMLNALEYLYRNPDDCLRMGARAKKMALEIFSYDEMIKAYFALYSTLYSSPPPNIKNEIT